MIWPVASRRLTANVGVGMLGTNLYVMVDPTTQNLPDANWCLVIRDILLGRHSLARPRTPSRAIIGGCSILKISDSLPVS